MRFHPNYPNDNYKGQHQAWNQIKNTFERDEGIGYYRYPIFAKTGRGRSEPDFLVVHREFGIWVLECKGCLIGQVGAIEGHDWIMRDWYCESMSPVSQVEAQLFEVRTLVERDPVLRRLRLPFEYRVVLPLIKRAEWRCSRFENHPSTESVVWLEEDLEPDELRRHLREATRGYMPDLSGADWARLQAAFRGVVGDDEPRKAEPGSPPVSPSRVIHAVESRLRVLDEKQDRVAQEVPEGPQRIRGLAGAGKTVLFARRIAQIHASHPDWNVAFVFWSRSLHQMIKASVEKIFRKMTGEEPDWSRLHIWHAWGGRDLTGFYRETARYWQCPFYGFKQAESLVEGAESPFGAAMRVLERDSQHGKPFLDAILVDEGQDLPAVFYRVAYRALRKPKRLYWAYDEAQGIDSLVVPNAAEVFGRDESGKPIVDLSGYYASGMQKAHNMNCCYRTPRLVLTAAHAINMGLLRDGGPLQGVTNKDDWLNLGYDVLEGDFSSASVKAQRPVVVTRTDTTSGHPVDDPEFAVAIDPSSILEVYVTANESDDVELVVSKIHRDLESGLRPDDIAVICMERWFDLLPLIASRLRQLGIESLLLDDTNKDQFRSSDRVTLTGVRRAKGNEAYKVYALNLHMAGPDVKASVDEEMVARNQAFVALTRAKLWSVAIGREGSILSELQKAKDGQGRLRFAAFNQASLKRFMGD